MGAPALAEDVPHVGGPAGAEDVPHAGAPAVAEDVPHVGAPAAAEDVPLHYPGRSGAPALAGDVPQTSEQRGVPPPQGGLGQSQGCAPCLGFTLSGGPSGSQGSAPPNA